ncbi:Bgt-20970 [Blumeria graminis f. sp. tritici]|uniref:Bgt-20970 n=2 Tax=Blumeria graminis f. sp. tritici TaxID=62690 RepID=A0A381LAJ6_BLUGR|nr:Bgt-20970 [Blumeria graminis f. sp. tritici]
MSTQNVLRCVSKPLLSSGLLSIYCLNPKLRRADYWWSSKIYEITITRKYIALTKLVNFGASEGLIPTFSHAYWKRFRRFSISYFRTHNRNSKRNAQQRSLHHLLCNQLSSYDT